MESDMQAAAPACSSHADRTKLPETTKRVDDHCSTCPSRRQTTTEGSLCSGENHDPPPPPAFFPSSSSSASVLSSLLPLVVAFSFDNKVELVVRAALLF
jgi:hypothetical protein